MPSSDRGHQRSAAMARLIVTVKVYNVDPRAWLADVLRRMTDHRTARLDELLPWNWTPAAGATDCSAATPELGRIRKSSRLGSGSLTMKVACRVFISHCK